MYFSAQLDPKTEQLEFQQMLMLRIDAADCIDAAVTPTLPFSATGAPNSDDENAASNSNCDDENSTAAPLF